MRTGRINKISGAVIIGLSLIALFTVLSGFLLPPEPPETDEGAAAHIFQLSIAAFVPTFFLFVATADWQRPVRTVRRLVLPISTLAVAFSVLYYMEHVYIAR